MEKDGNILLTYKEYSERRGMSEASIRQQVHRGNLWIIKIGKKPYIYAEDWPMKRKMGRPKKPQKGSNL